MLEAGDPRGHLVIGARSFLLKEPDERPCLVEVGYQRLLAVQPRAPVTAIDADPSYPRLALDHVERLADDDPEVDLALGSVLVMELARLHPWLEPFLPGSRGHCRFEVRAFGPSAGLFRDLAYLAEDVREHFGERCVVDEAESGCIDDQAERQAIPKPNRSDRLLRPCERIESLRHILQRVGSVEPFASPVRPKAPDEVRNVVPHSVPILVRDHEVADAENLRFDGG